MAKLSSVNALRLMISAVVSVAVFLAITSEGRSEKLDQWLRSGSAGLAPSDRQSLEDWIARTLVSAGVVERVLVNPLARDSSLRIIVYRDQIRGLFESGGINAAYDPALDSIFIDRRLVFDDDGHVRDEGLLEFVILHELGHRAAGHRGVSHFNASNSGYFSLLRPPSTSEEIEADNYAMAWMIRLRQGHASGPGDSTDQAVRQLDALIEESLLANLLTGNNLGLEQSDATHPALLWRARSLLQSMSLRPELSPKGFEEQKAYLDWIERDLADANGELSVEVLAPDRTTFQRGAETPFGAAFLLSDGRLVFIRGGEVSIHRSNDRVAIEFPTAGEPLQGFWPPELNSGSAFWWGNDGLYLLLPIGKLYFADSSSGWRWSRVSTLNLRPGVVAVSLSHRPASTTCPTLIFSGMDSVDVYRLVRSQERHAIELITTLNEPPIRSANRFNFEFAGSTSQDLYFWTNAGYKRKPSTQNIYEIPGACTGSGKVTPRTMVLPDVKQFRLSGIVPFPDGTGFLGIEIDPTGGQVIFHVLAPKQGSATFALAAHPRPPSYLEVPPDSTYDTAAVDEVYFLPGGRFVAMGLRGWGFYVLDLKNRDFALAGALNRVNLLSTPIGGTAAVATTLSGASRVLVWSFEGRN
jgi:hypothetical protein